MTVGELLARIDSRELTEWQVYERLHGPLGGQRDDQLAAMIAATISNAFRAKGKSPAKVSDFVPDWTGHREGALGGDDPEPDHQDRGP